MNKIDAKKIAVIGSGIVGQATGKGMADVGNAVVFYDTNPDIVQSLVDSGFDGRNIKELNDKNREPDDFDFFMLSVPTPTHEGHINLSFLERALQTLGKYIKNSSKKPIVVVRSTVSPGTTEKMAVSILEKFSGKKAGKGFGVAMNPEFLREVSAVEDFRHPWMVVVGSNDKEVADELGKLYAPFESEISYMSLSEAEMMKYAHNLLNAVKISFFNEMRVVANSIGADPDVMFPIVVKSAEAIWNPKYGIKNFGAYGGVCLPKDTVAFYTWASEVLGYQMPVLSGAIKTNELMKAIYDYSDQMEKSEAKKTLSVGSSTMLAEFKKGFYGRNFAQKNKAKSNFKYGKLNKLPL